MSNRTSRPIGVTILAILALVTAAVNVFHALQYLAVFPVIFGPVRFFTFNLLGALGFIFLAAIWVWVFRKLWGLEPQGWSFMTILAVINIAFAIIAILGSSTIGEELPAIIINVIVLVYAYSSGVKKAFNMP